MSNVTWRYEICEFNDGDQRAVWKYPKKDIAETMYHEFVKTIADFEEYQSGKVKVELSKQSLLVHVDNSIIPFEDPEFEGAMIMANQIAMSTLIFSKVDE